MHKIFPPNASYIDSILASSLREDVGDGYDLTSRFVLPNNNRAKFAAVIKQKAVVSGLAFVKRINNQLETPVDITAIVEDGSEVEAGETLFEIKGNVLDILLIERTILNIVSFLSGVATRTSQYCAAVNSYPCKVTHTRKTIPMHRAAQIYAVTCGGGVRHRTSLADAILIKDNHISAIDSENNVYKAVMAAKHAAGHMKKIAVEVDNLQQLQQAVDAEPDVIMLDNFSPDQVRQIMETIGSSGNSSIVYEISGGINLGNIENYARAGAKLISVGELTQSVKHIDIGLDAR